MTDYFPYESESKSDHTIIPTEQLPSDQRLAMLEPVAYFNDAMPTGVTVSQKGRIFVNFPRWGDEVSFTVAEVREGKAIAYPDEAMNQTSREDLAADDAGALVSVQSVVVDPADRLWILDTGSPMFQPTKYGGPKLVCMDLKTNQIVKKILFPQNVALPTTYLNDVRFDLQRGKEGVAYITDSAQNGPNGIIVVDLASGESWRRLNDHPSTKAEDLQTFLPIVEGRPFVVKEQESGSMKLAANMGSDGIAISTNGEWLYYCPLAGRRLYSVSAEALSNKAVDDRYISQTVKNEGDKGGASDGLESDAEGRIYATNYEHNSIMRRNSNGEWETIVYDPHLLWPDTLSLAHDGYLYVTANQLHRQARFHNGRDLRRKPYTLFRVKVNAKPVRLQ
ncbi:MAG TPA: L-dopachrome tautomerase-related protein [Nitrososphaera sp.]|jgi:sugar lactone lactonase YvrE|nr:L-dopachrome tautomerase-related protein [Nitrososphaera sp.]